MSETIHVYADGGVIRSNPSPVGGTWAFCFVRGGERFQCHSGVLRPDEGAGGMVTNNVTELYALCAAIWEARGGHAWLPMYGKSSHHFYSDSQVTLCRVFRKGALNGVPDWLAELTGKVRAFLPLIDFEYTLLDGHPTKAQLACGVGKRGNPCSEHNVWCDKACVAQAVNYVNKSYPPIDITQARC